MKVKDLIEKLQTFDENADVEAYAGYDCEYGDQWQSMTEVECEISGYSHQGKEIHTVYLK